MSPEIALYERELCWLLEHMRANVDALTERQLHWHPAQAQTNSAAAITNHMLESTRVYVLGFGCRQPVSRDRSTEFAPVNASRSSSSSKLLQLAYKQPSQCSDQKTWTSAWCLRRNSGVGQWPCGKSRGARRSSSVSGTRPSI